MKILSDGSDLEGVERTEDIPYLKILRKTMWIIDAWPRGPNEFRICRHYMIYLMILLMILGTTYLRNNTGKLSSFEMGHTYITACMNCIALTHILIHKISHFFTIYLIFLMCSGILLFNLTPMYNCYSAGMYRVERPQNATFEHSVYVALPFDYETNFKGYIGVLCFNWYNSCTCSCYFCMVDLTISIMVFHLWGHMRILKNNLDNFPKPASLLIESKEDEDNLKEHKYTEQESNEVHRRLRENIHYHSVIIDFQLRMSHVFGEVLLLYFLFHQVTECLLMLECSQMNKQALLRYGPLTVVIFQQLIKLSIIFELLGSSNDKLIDSVYCIPWEYMDTKNRKLVLVMMRQSQRSMNLKAMGVLSVGVQTMITILKTSFSYFVMLRTIAEEDQ